MLGKISLQIPGYWRNISTAAVPTGSCSDKVRKSKAEIQTALQEKSFRGRPVVSGSASRKMGASTQTET